MEKQFYLQRQGKLLDQGIEIGFKELKKYFNQIVKYHWRKRDLQLAFYGLDITNEWGDTMKEIPLTLAPSPAIYFLHHTGKANYYNIEDNYMSYTEAELFTIIEILYEHIAVYNEATGEIETKEVKEEFSNAINNILQFYKDGYVLEGKQGIILEKPNDAIINLLQSEPPESMNDDILSKFQHALKQYYRYSNNNLENKKNAIITIAGILENVREDLKEVLNREYNAKKNNHDKLIFDIVNNFDMRHDNEKQKTEYSKEVWYDWMMQYYSSLVMTYYRLIQEHEE